MVSKIACTSTEGAMTYFDKHLSRGDYFMAVDGAQQGVWMGSLAAEIGLEGVPITRGDFQSFLRCDPSSMGEGCSWQRARTSGLKYIEFTYTAPKSFSVAAALDDRLKHELAAAVREEFVWFEKAACARDRRGDLAAEEVTRETGNMMVAMFQHETSRTNDPNMHVHALVGNMTLDRGRDQLLALYYGIMLELRKTLDCRIHNNLARRSAKLGYTVEVAENGFALREVPREAVDLFSTRHRQVEAVRRLLTEGHSYGSVQAVVMRLRAEGRDRMLAEYGALVSLLGHPGGRAMTARVADEKAVLLTRPDKVEIDSETLTFRTRAMLAEAGLKIRQPFPEAVKIAGDLDSAVRQAAKAVFEKHSVVRLDELIGEVARLAPGVLENSALSRHLKTDARFHIAKLPHGDNGRDTDLVTTRGLVMEERRLLQNVRAGLDGGAAPITPREFYQTPAVLENSPERIRAVLEDAARSGEELSADQAESWLRQFSDIHRYVSTSTDQFVNIRGGAGVGKTFCMEILVQDSLSAGRRVILAAPYGEQSRVTLRNEASKLHASGKAEVAAAFENANTVAHWLALGRASSAFRVSLSGTDIFVDEAGLLDMPTAGSLVQLARETGARIIFQGDTEQKQAVGRGAPLHLLQERLGLGMSIERASISRRQRFSADKALAQELSSGDPGRFRDAIEAFITRGDVMETPAEDICRTAATYLILARDANLQAIAFSSVHRLCDEISEEIHRRTKEIHPALPVEKLDAWKGKNLQPAELLSSQFYQEGDLVEWKNTGRLRHAAVEGVRNGVVMIRQGSQVCSLNLGKVTAIHERKGIERAVGAQLALTEKIQYRGRTHERNSLHRIKKFAGTFVVFDTGLRLPLNDGRLRQGDVLTTDKAQGAKGSRVFWIEDNRSLMAMADRQTVHVGFTRHVGKITMLVESVEIFRAMASREREKIAALRLFESGTPSTWVSHEKRQPLDNTPPRHSVPRITSPSAVARKSRVGRLARAWKYRLQRPALLHMASVRVQANAARRSSLSSSHE